MIEAHGLFRSLYTDRARHYWYTHEVEGKESQANLTQFGRAMEQLGIEMVPVHSRAELGYAAQAFTEHRRRLAGYDAEGRVMREEAPAAG